MKDSNLTLISVRVSTRKSQLAIKEVTDEGLVKIDLTCAPVEGKANLELMKYLAELLETHADKIEIRTGLSNRNKLINIKSIDRVTVLERLRNKIT